MLCSAPPALVVPGAMWAAFGSASEATTRSDLGPSDLSLRRSSRFKLLETRELELRLKADFTL